jgi:hypothetical protein
MAFILSQFDGLEVPIYIQRSDSQDIGNGNALMAFLSLPGGGFFDNFGSGVSGQSIQPIHKGGVLLGDADELREQLHAWRAKLGKRGKLTTLWDDGTLLWHWARLQSASSPRGGEMKGGYLPIDFTWMKGAQGWRGPLHGADAWVWGDGSWTFGDGSAEFDSGSYTYTLADSNEVVTITNSGTTDAPYILLRLEMTGTWQDVTIINQTTGQQIIINRDTSDSKDWLEINTGSRVIIAGAPSSHHIDTAYRTLNEILVTTLEEHGITTGDSVRITGTTIYDGDYDLAVYQSTTQFQLNITPDISSYGTVTYGTGMIQELTSLYADATITDRKRWLTLAPGDNDIQVIWSPFPTTATLKASYYDQYS